MGGSNASAGHDEEEEDHGKDGEDFDPRHPVFDVAIHSDWERIAYHHHRQINSDISGKRYDRRLWPELEHIDCRCDFCWNDRHALEPEIDPCRECEDLINVSFLLSDESSVHWSMDRQASARPLALGIEACKPWDSLVCGHLAD